MGTALAMTSNTDINMENIDYGSGVQTRSLSAVFSSRNQELDPLLPQTETPKQESKKSFLLETAAEDDAKDFNHTTRVIEKVKVQTRLQVEADYYGVINGLDTDKSLLSAVIYDKSDNVDIMEVDIPFSQFSDDDQKLFKLNSVFYWQIGKRSEYSKNKLGRTSKKQVNFSSFRMRRLFVDMDKQEKRIKALSEKYKKVLQSN